MRIGNKYVQIKQGNKTYTKKNMILDTMINKIFLSQISPTYNKQVEIKSCGIKFDTPLENLNYYSVLNSNDFDVVLTTRNYDVVTREKLFKNKSVRSSDNITINYNFSVDGYFVYEGTTHNAEEFERFVGRKITAIGFGNENLNFLAVVDVSDMNIIINQNEKLEIYRTDIYQSDAKCIGFDYPLHLVNNNAKYNAKYQTGTTYIEEYTQARLYSIGLGNKEGLMESEHIIDISEEEVGYNYINIDFSELIKVGHYPSEDLFPGFYPTMDNSKYLILKYQLCKIDYLDNITPLDEYYTMSYKYDLSQYEGETKNISFTLKIERM